jgi:multicomponent Na+:H+ antiporter subunit F
MSAPDLFMAMLLVGAFLCLYRLGKGPTAPDRTVAVDTLGTLIVGFCGIYALTSGSSFYINVGIAWALLSFVGSIALAKYLEGKAYDE